MATGQSYLHWRASQSDENGSGAAYVEATRQLGTRTVNGWPPAFPFCCSYIGSNFLEALHSFSLTDTGKSGIGRPDWLTGSGCRASQPIPILIRKGLNWQGRHLSTGKKHVSVREFSKDRRAGGQRSGRAQAKSDRSTEDCRTRWSHLPRRGFQEVIDLCYAGISGWL